ncbi:MAG: thiaminase II [Gemmatimonadetes bacterium]|uniref:Aminopyrimidine aminohydrolase n=1 Tax=Candidatus Kutchimonas denitrificans TaxID=3056748 RepID=A0AAE4Z563_9BACT|nr:thiaminase II [Gemmatimonadota bacterium]NIR73534.1 thiaminase II [Candidatus Kutchimonas denitrificans]NIR99493.1 thiaminase II [Gemmatimonadota bacterium]NIT65113.1 thiaminase II [Gemmatimonadota bacterium]NIV23646.1 thiaminase II [Gemmatimonadota bacterium]
MAFTDELRAAAEPIWDAQLEHPFVRGIGDGSLEENRFANWVLQDYRYLKEFARVFAWAAAKAERLESMMWYATVLDLTLNTEMDLHRQYAARFGLSPDDLEAAPMWPTTRAYTDFLVRTAADGDMADLVAALLPCAWGYVHVAKHLAEVGGPEDQRYADWIAQYASEEFAQAADWLKGEMNRLAEGTTADKRDRLKNTFLLSSRYEWAFWEMCWHGEAWPV